jgi:SulP family sulfate permease
MASGVLAGVSPIHGLYASMAGPIGGGLASSTQLMVIATTSAAALASGSAIARLDPQGRESAIVLLTWMAGALMVVAGLLRLGRLTRFVSYSVMLGFLTGVGFNIIFGQLPDLAGVAAQGSTSVAKAIFVLTHLGEVHLASFLTGLATLAILFGVHRTRFRSYGALLALIVPTVIAALTNAEVAIVSDQGEIPAGLPLPALPDLSAFSLDLLAGAVAVAAIVLVQGAGVAEAAPNLDGSRSRSNQDFMAQGVGNLASAAFKGQPVGGSVGQTALNRAAGATTRWASILSGVWMLLILVFFAGLAGTIAMPTLAAILIYAAIGSFKPGEIATIWQTGPSSQIAIVTTFISTLFAPIALAVLIGAALSMLLQVNRDALDLTLRRIVPEDGRFREEVPPKRLETRTVTMLDIYGSLFFAGARTLEVNLPDPIGSERPAVVVRLRGRTALGATALRVLSVYAEHLDRVGGRLYLSGVDPELVTQFERTGIADTDAMVLFAAGEYLGESSMAAYEAAERFVAG